MVDCCLSLRRETDEVLTRVGRVKPTDSVLDPTVSAFSKVRVLRLVPFHFKSESGEEVLEEAQEIPLAALLGQRPVG